MYEINFNKLFEKMCCSVCKHDFNDEAIKVKKREKGVTVIEIVCPECKKNFGTALIGLPVGKTTKPDEPFEINV